MKHKLVIVVFVMVLLTVPACGLPAVPIIQQAQDAVATVQDVNEELSRPVGPYFGSTDQLPTPNYTPSQDDYYMVGQQVDSGSVSWIVLGWFTVEEPFMPAPTLYIDLLMVNRSNSQVYLQNSYTSKDIQGQDTYDVTTITLNPGERVRSWLTFLLVEAQPSLLVLDQDTSYGLPSQRIIWDLGPVPSAVEAPVPLNGEQAQEIHSLGEVVTLGSLTIQAMNVTYPPVNDQTPVGYKYINVDLVIENTGSVDVEIDPVYAAWLKDAEGFEYSTTFAIAGSSIFPGGKLVTTAKFEVPETASGLMYEFDGSYLGLQKIFILVEP